MDLSSERQQKSTIKDRDIYIMKTNKDNLQN